MAKAGMALRSGKAAHIGQRRGDGLVEGRMRFDAQQVNETLIVEAHGVFPRRFDLQRFLRKPAKGRGKTHHPPREGAFRNILAALA